MVRNLLQYSFCLRPTQSPTYYNLNYYLHEINWQSSFSNEGTVFNELNFEFDTRATQTLEFKHLLASLVARYCPEVMPLTYLINDSNSHDVISLIERQQQPIWILKPSLLNNGQHIKIFQELNDLKSHYLSSKRMGGDHVLQHYITQPHVLSGHKYSIRMFVVLTNDVGSYIYPHGYLNVAKQVYQANYFVDLRSHLTNEHLHHDEPNVVQVPTKPVPGFDYIYQQIKVIVSKTIGGLRSLHPQAFTRQEQRTLAIFGFDFIVDADLRVWLLEANHGPCFPCGEHPLQQALYADFWRAFITGFVEPIATQCSASDVQYQAFEWVGGVIV